jgi:hypothetical protein
MDNDELDHFILLANNRASCSEPICYKEVSRETGQEEAPRTQKEKYDALYPTDTPAATGEKSELEPGEEKPTLPQEASDARGDGGPQNADGDLGQPGSGQIRPSGSRPGVGPMPKGREVDLPDATRPNFFISDPERMVGGGAKGRFNRNRRAIETFQSIQEEGGNPTDDEIETMAGFTGWGSFGQDLFLSTFEHQPPRPGWDAEARWLREHLSKEA